MCGNDGLQQVSGLFFPSMDTIPLRSLHAKGGVGRTQKTTYDFNSNERVQSSECTAIVCNLRLNAFKSHKKLLFIANLKSPPNDHASFYASSEKDRFLYTSCLIASRKRTRSDIYVVRIPFRSVLSMIKAGSGEHKKQLTISIPMSELSQASVRQLF